MSFSNRLSTICSETLHAGVAEKPGSRPCDLCDLFLSREGDISKVIDTVERVIFADDSIGEIEAAIRYSRDRVVTVLPT